MADEDDRHDPRAWLRMLVRIGASLGARCVANALVGYAAPRMVCEPRYATIAGVTGLHETTVMAHIRVFREAGALVVHERFGPRGQQLANQFEFTWPEDEAAALDVVSGRRRPGKLTKGGRSAPPRGGSARPDPPPSARSDPGGLSAPTRGGRSAPR
ncbi:MAG: hypothetical protein M9894_32595, partial [Planctomycetes bacterium]|nr:hypothetical protein [Planctomycetota bacterium]